MLLDAADVIDISIIVPYALCIAAIHLNYFAAGIVDIPKSAAVEGACYDDGQKTIHCNQFK
jgi:hypothetical protein